MPQIPQISKLRPQKRRPGQNVTNARQSVRASGAPGSGTIDFDSLKPLVKPEQIKVFEFSPSLTVEQAAAGVAFIKERWGEE